MTDSQNWYLSLTYGESTELNDVAKVDSDGESLTFQNAAGEVVCIANRSLLVYAKRIDLSGGKR